MQKTKVWQSDFLLEDDLIAMNIWIRNQSIWLTVALPRHSVKVLVYCKKMILHGNLDLISWKILLKTCCLKSLIRYDTMQCWAELSESRRILPYLNTEPEPVVELLTPYMGFYELNRKWSCFCCFSNLFKNSLNVQCIHDKSNFW